MLLATDLSLLPRATDNSTAALGSFAEEIKCYNLPYGVLGFVSHVLTYYTIICLWFGRKPLWPFSRVSFSRLDLALGGLGLLISTLLSIVTTVRCQDTWQLLVIAIWKMSMSLLNGLTAVHVAIMFILRKIKANRERKRMARQEGSEERDVTVEEPNENRRDGEKAGVAVEKASDTAEEEDKETPISVAIGPLKWVSWWIVLYLPGMFAGIAGLMSLVVKGYDHAGVRGLTAGFYTIVGAGALIVVLGILYRMREQHELGQPGKVKRVMLGALVWTVGSFSVLAVFYSDWVLGMMTNNLTGLPSGDNSALFWTYWVAKRLPMFSL